MNKYLEKIAELSKEAMNAGKIVDRLTKGRNALRAESEVNKVLRKIGDKQKRLLAKGKEHKADSIGWNASDIEAAAHRKGIYSEADYAREEYDRAAEDAAERVQERAFRRWNDRD